jgi:hypothetical protein
MTTVKKIIGAITILINLMKISANTFNLAPNSGNMKPIAIPRRIPITT